MKINKKKFYFLLTIFALISVITLVYFVSATGISSDSVGNNWTMFNKYLNHSGWDGVSFPTTTGLTKTLSIDTGTEPWNAPIIINGYAYTSGANGYRYKLNASNISQVITFVNSGISSTEFQPCYYNGYVYMGGADGAIYKVDTTDMTSFYKYTTGSPNALGGTCNIYTIGGTPFIYFGSTGGTTGSGMWQLYAGNLSLYAQYNSTTTGSDFAGGPAIANGYVYGGTTGGKFFQLNASNVTQLINTYSVTGGFSNMIETPPTVYNGYVYFGTIGTNINARLFQLNASTLTLVNSYTTNQIAIWPSSPTIYNGYVYFGALANASSSTAKGEVYQLNATNLNYVSSYSASDISNNDIESTPTAENGYLYIGSDANETLQLNASNISQLISKINTDGPITSPISYANGYIYFTSAAGTVYQVNATRLSSCYYSGSGNWFINASEACNITSNVDLLGNNLYISGAGTVTINGANITNFTYGKLNDSAKLKCENNGCLRLG